MEIEYKGKNYLLVELNELKKGGSFDIVAIFEIEHNKQDFEEWEIKKFVNYFYGALCENNTELIEIINIAHDYINDYLKQQEKNNQEKELKKAYCRAFKKASKKEFASIEFEDLENKQYKLLDFFLDEYEKELKK